MAMFPNLLYLSVLCLVTHLTLAQDDNLDKLAQRVPGVPGQDYPIFSVAPETSFLCEVQPVEGYYADPEGDCQLYHICSDIGDGLFSKFDFLCPNGTIFNQEEFVCDWWFNVDCSKAESFYELNIEVAEKNAERQRLRDLERAEEAEEGTRRERKELSSEQISNLRTGNRQEKSQKETPSRSNTKSKQSSQPFNSNLQISAQISSKQPSKISAGNNRNSFGGNNRQTSTSFKSNNRQTSNSDRGNNRQTSTSFGGSSTKKSNTFKGSNRQASNSQRGNKQQTSNFFGGSNSKTISSFGVNTAQNSNSFGGNSHNDNTRQTINSFGGNTQQTKNAFGGSTRKIAGQNRQSSSNQTTRKRVQKTQNLGSNSRQVAKPTGRNKNVKNSRTGKLRKTAQKTKVKPFTNFGNGQSRFGNF